MESLKIIVLSVVAVSMLLILIFALSGKNTLKTLFLNMFTGLCVLLIFKMLSVYIGIEIPINKYTVAGCGLLGIPALIGFLILNLIFI